MLSILIQMIDPWLVFFDVVFVWPIEMRPLTSHQLLTEGPPLTCRWYSYVLRWPYGSQQLYIQYIYLSWSLQVFHMSIIIISNQVSNQHLSISLTPKEAVTCVLMGNIGISRTIFPSGTEGECNAMYKCSETAAHSRHTVRGYYWWICKRIRVTFNTTTIGRCFVYLSPSKVICFT